MLNETEMATPMETLSEFQAKYFPGGPFLAIGDDREATGMTWRSRTVFAKRRFAREHMRVAVFGGTIAMRTLLVLAFKVVAYANPTVVLHAVADEAEARPWLGEEKVRLAAKARVVG